MVPRPAIKNGIETCSVVFHHSSCLTGGWPIARECLRSNPFPPSPLSPPFGSSDDAMDVVVIELNEPCDEAGKTENFSLSLSKWKRLPRENGKLSTFCGTKLFEILLIFEEINLALLHFSQITFR